MSGEELHIASLVVHATPGRVHEVARVVAGVPGAEVHASSPAGKLVVTLEASGAQQMSDTISRIERVEGVLGAALVYQSADTLEAMNEEIDDA